ncbi:MAG: M14 family metallopeptidase [Gemmatimonadales bacterium]
MHPFLVRTHLLRSMVLAGGMLLLTAAAQPQEEPRYHTYDQLTSALRSLVNEYSSLARMESLAQTREGRDIWVLELANSDGAPLEERPALLIVANLEGDHLVGSELALATVRHFLTSYESDSDVRERLDNHVVYVFPRLNPDAAELMFADVLDGRRTNSRPFDDDNDARIDEDGPEDLNGDGVVTLMRLADPSGDYVIHPDEPRLMKRAEPVEGESGQYALYIEGIDNDGDGFYNEDGPGGVDLNRNFQHAYPYYTPDAGYHMVSEPESRALMDFVVAHRNIAMVLTFGASDNLVSAPATNGRLSAPKAIQLAQWANASNSEAPSVGTFAAPSAFFGFGFRGFRGGGQQEETTGRRPPPQRPDSIINRRDVEYFRKVSEQYREITGISEAATTRAPRGAFFEYGYFQFGVPSFSTPGWGLPEAGQQELSDSAAPEPEAAPTARRAPGQGPPAAGVRQAGRAPRSTSDQTTDQRLLAWMDQEGVDGFVEWETFDHPDLGEVEIGGFKPYVTVNPPAAELPSLGESHAAFAVYLMSLFADVGIASTEVTSHGAGVFEVKAVIQNTGFLPTAMQHGVRARAVPAVMVQLDVPPEDVITGAAKTSLINSLNGSGAREEFLWMIRGEPGDRVELRVRSTKAGLDSQTITLR